MAHLMRLLGLVLLIVFAGVTASLAGEVIQTQEGDLYDGIQADLLDLTAKNNVVTVKIKLRNTGSADQNVKIAYDACYIMDETNQKKYFALKDSDGTFIAGPSYDSDRGGRFWYDIEPQQAKNLWIKFPQPTDNPATITVSLPGIFPFEEIPLPK